MPARKYTPCILLFADASQAYTLHDDDEQQQQALSPTAPASTQV